VPKILIGNKCDLNESRVISYQQASDLAVSLGIEYIEASAKDNQNILNVFEMIGT
jgi:GTPase SAR1 family protein